MRRRVFAEAILLFGLAGCGPSEASVALWFPNEAARDATRRIRVEVHTPEAASAVAGERTCRDFLGMAQEGRSTMGAVSFGNYECAEGSDAPCAGAWFDGRELPDVPPGRHIIYVLGFPSTEEDANPTLEGCTDQFDTRGGKAAVFEVPLRLELVLPPSARLVKVAGDRQVGRSGDEIAVPLEVRVEADAPRGRVGTYAIPGVPVVFTSPTPGFQLLEGAAAGRHDTVTGVGGRASSRVQLPDRPGTGQIVARAPALETALSTDRSERTFSVSVTEPVVFPSREVVDAGGGLRSVAVALGDLDGQGGLDLALLGCAGTAAGCVTGVSAAPPFGSTRLRVIRNVGSRDRTILQPAGDLGILPAGLVIADLLPAPGVGEIAVVNSRRADCQERRCTAGAPCPCWSARGGGPCPCEGSEILVFEARDAQVRLVSRHTMTGSNAVALTEVRHETSAYAGLGMAAQGRSKNERPCNSSNACLPYDPEISPECSTSPELCGCPPEEACDRRNTSSGDPIGWCTARDKRLDLLLTRTTPPQDLYNAKGCQQAVLRCNRTSPVVSECACLDEDRGNLCTGVDEICGCRVPERIPFGELGSSRQPFGLVAGPLENPRDWDVVVPNDAGFGVLRARSRLSYTWRGPPIVNAPIHGAIILPLDRAADLDAGLTTDAPDLVWYARSRCEEGMNFLNSCPMWRDVPAEEKRGCLGAYFTDGQRSIYGLRTPATGGCRRHHLPILPDGLCSGRFNSDEHVDVAMASSEARSVWIYTGDGRGGLLDPPEKIELPAGGVGGPLACGDVDGDGLDDIVVADRESGALYVLRSGP